MFGGFFFAGFYVLGYAGVALLSSMFFAGALPRFNLASLRSIAILAISIIAVFVVVLFIPDTEFGNRFQHAVGGGVLGVVLCYLVFRDQRIKATRFQFFAWSVLVVLALGVANELFEYVVQANTNMTFANSIYDTWRDLASNSVGIALAAPVAALARPRV